MMTQEIRDHHEKEIRESITKGETHIVSCLNYMAKFASDESARKDWQFIGQNLIMHGWLTVNAENTFVVK